MTKLGRQLGHVLLLLVVCVGVAGCGGGPSKEQRPLVGAWGNEGVDKNFNRVEVSFDLRRDSTYTARIATAPSRHGKGNEEVEEGTWDVQEETLTLTNGANNSTETMRIVEVTDDALTLADEDDDISFQLWRRQADNQ